MVAFAGQFESAEPVDHRASLLLVEDEEAVRELLVRILSNEYEIFTAGNCEEAQGILESEPIDIIICDHGLPGENGLDFLARIRSQYPFIQRILLTGQREVELAIRAINEGDVHRYLPKPADFATVCEAISSGLEKRKRLLSDQKIAEENASMRKKMNSLPYFMRRLRVLSMEGGRFMTRAMGIYFIGSLGFFICGVGVLAALYLIKTIAGVNLLSLDLEQIAGQFHQWAVGLSRL